MTKIVSYITHLIGKLTKQYYFEDYVRVYPNGIVFNRFGQRIEPLKNDINNFLNHEKFYKFAAQFVKGKLVADIGCGSGYGCAILKQNGSQFVSGSDISKASIYFAKNHYDKFADFTIQGITELKEYESNYFDVTISSEVLEHIKEYGPQMVQISISEIKRITKKNGLIIVGTPNCELLGKHGFSFDEINHLFNSNFSQFCIFENAIIPFNEISKISWDIRQSKGKTGIIISEDINLSETVQPEGRKIELKKGIKPGVFKLGNQDIDTKLLHNTHSWVIVAINE
jgi:SAM-dependent methyltransferase